MTKYSYKPLGDDQTLRRAWARSGSLSFRMEPDRILEYLDRMDRHNWCRVLVDEHNELIATLMNAKVGMFLSGRRVTAESVGFVCIPPEHRGKRASVEIMHRHLHEAHSNGSALSVLFSARARLYRGVGYETAGRRNMVRIPLRTLKLRSQEGIDQVTVRPMCDEDYPDIRALYTGFARDQHGYLDREDWHWNYLLGSYQKNMRPGFVFEHNGTLSGYMVLTRGEHLGPKQGSETDIHDLAFADAPTARAMIRFLSGFASTWSHANFGADTAHPIFDHADELWHQVISTDLWMVRIVDVASAISQRGFHPCVSGELVLGITDPILDHNTGNWKIRIDSGKASILKTDEPAKASMDITSLAPIYTGFMTATQMHLNGRVDADQHALSMLDGLFASATPAMVDDF